MLPASDSGVHFNIVQGTYCTSIGHKPVFLRNHPNVRSYNGYKKQWEVKHDSFATHIRNLQSEIALYKGMMSNGQKELSNREIECPKYKLLFKKPKGVVKVIEPLEDIYLDAYRQHLQQKTPGYRWVSRKDMVQDIIQLQETYEKLKHESDQLFGYLGILSKLGSLSATFEKPRLVYEDGTTDLDIPVYKDDGAEIDANSDEELFVAKSSIPSVSGENAILDNGSGVGVCKEETLLEREGLVALEGEIFSQSITEKPSVVYNKYLIAMVLLLLAIYYGRSLI